MPCGCHDDPAFVWLCINTESQSESQVLRELQSLELVAWLPQYKAYKPASRIKPLFPSYLFCQVNLAEDAWRRIYRTRGVVTILGTRYERPRAVPNAAMLELWARVDTDGLISERTSPTDFLPGAGVAFGPGSVLTGICEKSSAERVTILFQLLGREVRTTVPRAKVVSKRDL